LYNNITQPFIFEIPYIYLIHCRASVNAKENVYKIGKSVDFNKRLDGYDKGSIPIFTIYVCECDDFERLLITIFRSKFIIRADCGFFGRCIIETQICG